MKTRYLIILINFFSICALIAQDTILFEGFESGELPVGWNEIKVKGDFSGDIVHWEYQDGGHAAHPPAAASGNYNALFYYESYSNEATKLITPSFSLLNRSKPVLRFQHVMETWTWGSDYWDQLIIYYRRGADSTWVLWEEYLNPVENWTEQELLIADSLFTDDFYIAFEGITGYGHGVCVDDVLILETDTATRRIDKIRAKHVTNKFIPTRTVNNVMMRIDFYVIGNNGQAILNSIDLSSLNTDNGDLSSNGVNLYLTSDSIFSTENQIGTSADFISGQASFSGLNVDLSTGYTAVWVTYNIDALAKHGNRLDLMISADDIDVNSITYPSTNLSPSGYRLIEESIIFDDFELDNGWSLSGEFERDIPQGIGGNGPGFPDPEEAYSGDTIIGTDLSGLNTNLGDIEPNITSFAYQAISPLIDCKFYKDIKISYRRWLNVDLFDKAYIHTSNDNANSWDQIWVNGSFYTDNEWNLTIHDDITSNVERSDSVRVRFSMGPSNGLNEYSGWNIDDFVLTGDYIENDVGVSDWVTPIPGCGNSDSETVTIKIKNYGPTTSKDTIPLCYSFDGGSNYVYDTLFESIEPEQEKAFSFTTTYDLSTPGHYNNIIAKTLLESDEYDLNDQLDTTLYIEPTYSPPYSESFESGTGFWITSTDNLWERGTPEGIDITNAYSGSNAWITDLNGYYGDEDSSYLESPCFNLSGTRYPVMDFMINHVTETRKDGMVIMFSLDGGESWDFMDSLDYQWDWNWYSEDTTSSLEHPGFDGNSNGWIMAKQFIPEAIRNESSVKFRFVFESDTTNNSYDGVAIDDIRLIEIPPDVGITELVAPDSACEFLEKQLIKIAVKNFGYDTLFTGTEIPVGFDLNGSYYTSDTITLTSNLIPEDTVHFTFADSVEMATSGRYYYDIYTMLDGDNDYYIDSVNNDTLNTFISVYGMPEYDLGPTIGMETIDTILDAGADYASYNWESGDSLTRYYRVTTEGLYDVTVINIHGCSKSDTVRVIQSVEDLGVTALISPNSDCEFSSDTVVNITISNFKGATYGVGDTIVVGYILNNNPKVVDSVFLTSPIGALGTYDYEFSDPVDLSNFQDYSFEFFTILEGDLDYSNDTLSSTITAWGYPDVEIGPDTIRTSEADTILFDAGAGFASYLWQDGSSNQTYSPTHKRSNKYFVTVTDVNGCGQDKDSVQINAYDFGVEQIVNPTDNCELTSNENITIRIRNLGQDTIPTSSNIPVSYSINGSPEVNEIISLPSDLNPNSIYNHTFSSTEDLSSVDDYIFDISCSFANDINETNDTLQETVSNWGYPIVDLGQDTIYTSVTDTVILTANTGYASYLWNTGSSDNTLEIPNDNSTWYVVTVLNEYGCETKDSTFIFTYDVGIIDINMPTNKCEGTSTENLRVNLWNYGSSTINAGTIIPVSYRVDGGSWTTEDFTLLADLNSSTAVGYTFSSTVDMTTTKSYNFEIYTSLANDVISSNDDFARDIEIYGYPDIDIGADTLFTNQPDTVILVADPGYSNYMWNTGVSNDSLTITDLQSYMYKVRVGSVYGCNSNDSVYIYTFDIGVSDILGPISDCELTASESISVRITNNSSDTLLSGEDIDVAYTINGGGQVTESVTLAADLLPSGTVDYTFSATEDLTATGEYEIDAFTLWYRDVGTQNDNYVDTVHVYGYPSVNIGADTTIRALDYTLDAGGPYVSYDWQDGSSNQTFNVTTSGTYYVTVEDIYTCQGSDTIDILLLMPDFMITDVIDPESKCFANGNVNPIVRMTNTGTDTIQSGEGIDIEYYINDVLVDQQSFTVDSDLIPGDSADFTFSSQLDVLAYQNHNFKLISDFSRDLNPNNDTVLLTKYIYPFPTVNLGNDTVIRSKQLTINVDYDENYSYLWQDGITTDPEFTAQYDGSLIKSYSVTVSDTRMTNCSSDDDINITFLITDVEILDITLPDNICQFGKTAIQVDYKNEGNANIASSTRIYIGVLDQNGEFDETSSTAGSLITPGDSSTLDSELEFKHSGNQDVKIYLRMVNDGDQTNDTLVTAATTLPAPVSNLGGDSDTLQSSLPTTLSPTQGESAYSWNDGSSNSTLTANEQQWYWVDITGSNGCTSRDSVYVSGSIDIIPISELNGKIFVYPVPTRQILYIKSNKLLSENYDYMIMNGEGKVVINGKMFRDQKVDISQNIEKLPPGIYYLKIYNLNNSYSRKLLFNSMK